MRNSATLVMRKVAIIAILLFTGTFSFSQTASFTVSDSIECAPFTVNFTNLSVGADSFYWDFDDGLYSFFTHPVHIFYEQGTYNVTLYAYDSLLNVDSASFLITVPGNLPFFILVNEACPGKSLQFAVYGNYDPGNIILWDFDDGFTSNNSFLEHSFTDTGTYSVVLTVTNSACGTMVDSNQITITNTVIPPVHIHPEYADTIICPGENFPFFYDELLPIMWDFGDGNTSTDPYPTHIYDSSGIYQVTITVTNECGNSNTVDTNIVVDANAVPVAAIFVYDSVICPGQMLTFSATPGFGYSYFWDFGDGNKDTGQLVVNSYPDTGTYISQLVVTNLCGNSDTAYKTMAAIDSLLPVGFMYIDNKNICPGTAITFVAPGGFSGYQWNFGDGDTSSSASGNHTYTDTGAYTVQLIIINACGNSALYIDTVVVGDFIIPSAGFFIGQASYCPGDIIQFNPDTSVWTGTDIVSYFWDFGDSNTDTLKNSIHTYIDTGTYTVTLVVFNSCGNSDTLTRQIILDSSASPVTSFYVFPDNKVCTGTNLFFTNTGSDTSNCTWTFGDGDTSYLSNPTHIYSSGGNYFVQLTVINNCGKMSTSSEVITVTAGNMPGSPIVSCNQIGDTILFTWSAVSGASGYEISSDSGLNWSNPSGPGLNHNIIGSTGNTFSVVVRALGQADCPYGAVSQTVTCTILAGIEPFEPDDLFKLYPNPSSGKLRIAINKSAKEPVKIAIYNSIGAEVRIIHTTEKMTELDLTTLPGGVYIIKSDYGKILRLILVR